jgi:RNA polymerase sigma-70 factor (ECF subfamily)
MEHTLDPDHVLVAACQRGHEPCDDPFRVLHDRHKDLVLRVCLRITGDANEALDATQDAFLLAYRGIRAFRFRSRFSRWLCSIAAHASFERVRRRRPPCPFSDLETPEFRCRRDTDPRVVAESREHRARVHLALRRLSPHLREILVLRYVHGLSYQELSTRLVIAEGSVRSRLHRAHRAMSCRVSSLEESEIGAES